MLLTHRKLLQSKAIAIENDLRASLRNFGLKVGMIGTVKFEARTPDGRLEKRTYRGNSRPSAFGIKRTCTVARLRPPRSLERLAGPLRQFGLMSASLTIFSHTPS